MPEDVPELLPEGAVDEKVDGRTEHLEHVAQLHDDEADGATDLDVVLPDYLDEARRRVADHEDENDDDHDECDVLLVAFGATAHAHAGALPAHGAVGDDETRVEPGEKQQRHDETDGVVQDVEVDELR